MRDIKFRAWSIEKQSWIYFGICNVPRWVHEAEIEQFTGLYDKNGKEIYEGDIVEWQSVSRFSKMVVRFEDQRWYPWLSNEMTIIGNIQENPDLMG